LKKTLQLIKDQLKAEAEKRKNFKKRKQKKKKIKNWLSFF